MRQSYFVIQSPWYRKWRPIKFFLFIFHMSRKNVLIFKEIIEFQCICKNLKFWQDFDHVLFIHCRIMIFELINSLELGHLNYMTLYILSLHFFIFTSTNFFKYTQYFRYSKSKIIYSKEYFDMLPRIFLILYDVHKDVHFNLATSLSKVHKSHNNHYLQTGVSSSRIAF
jgi:hypothetical protein